MKLLLIALLGLFISTSAYADFDNDFYKSGAVQTKVVKTSNKIASKHHFKQVYYNASVSHSDDVVGAISKPARYVGGRLICAINVGLALAERGLKGTGSALAASYRSWGHATANPKAGDVAFNWRKGGGHVSIVAKVTNGTVYVWNPSPHGQGWQLRVNPYHSEYRSASL